MRRLVIVRIMALSGFLSYTLYRDTRRLAVKTVVVTRDQVRLTLSTGFTGPVVTDREATLSSQTDGQLRSLGVQERLTVEVGEMLARLNDVEAKAHLRMVEANRWAV